MDIKEFNLIYNKDSPFFGKGLESIIEQALKEEQVPHSIRPISDKKCDIIPAISFQTNMTHDKEVNIYERKSALVAGKSDPQDGSTVNKDFKQRTRNAQANPLFNPNSVPVGTSRPILVSSALHMSSSYNSSRSSRHSFTHASHNFSLRAPCNDAHARSTGYKSSVSETSSYSKTTSNFSEKLPATGTEVPKNYLKDNRSAFDHSQQDKFNITGEYSSAPRLALFNENCCGIVKCEEKHTNCRKESLTNMADSLSERQTPTHSAVDSVSTWGCSFQKDPFNTVEKHLASTYTVDSHRELDGIGKDKAFDVCKSNGRISSEQITRCRNDLQTMPCESRTSGNAHESSEPPASAASPYHDRQVAIQCPHSAVATREDTTVSEREVGGGETEKVDINNDQSDIIIPVEIGRFDTKEITTMIERLVKANQYFTEFPRTDEPEKQTLIEEQTNYLVKKKVQAAAPRSYAADEKEKIRSQVLEHSVKYIEMRIAESVRFAKRIPGFLDLPLEDQANLIRESRTESGIVGGMRGINAEKGVFSTRHGAFFSFEEMKLVFDETLLYEKMMLSKKIAKLNLSLEEEAILRAMTITATDRCKLLRRDRVEDIQNKLMSCLLHVISEKGSEPVSRRLCKLFDVLMCCRYVTEVDLKQVKKIFLEWPSFSNYKLAEEFL